jgi:hypothetical protein
VKISNREAAVVAVDVDQDRTDPQQRLLQLKYSVDSRSTPNNTMTQYAASPKPTLRKLTFSNVSETATRHSFQYFLAPNCLFQSFKAISGCF